MKYSTFIPVESALRLVIVFMLFVYESGADFKIPATLYVYIISSMCVCVFCIMSTRVFDVGTAADAVRSFSNRSPLALGLNLSASVGLWNVAGE